MNIYPTGSLAKKVLIGNLFRTVPDRSNHASSKFKNYSKKKKKSIYGIKAKFATTYQVTLKTNVNTCGLNDRSKLENACLIKIIERNTPNLF